MGNLKNKMLSEFEDYEKELGEIKQTSQTQIKPQTDSEGQLKRELNNRPITRNGRSTRCEQ